MLKEVACAVIGWGIFSFLRLLGFDRVERLLISISLVVVILLFSYRKNKKKDLKFNGAQQYHNQTAEAQDKSKDVMCSTLCLSLDVPNIYSEISNGVTTQPVKTVERIYITNGENNSAIISIGPATYNINDPRRIQIAIALENFHSGLERQIYNLMNNRAAEIVKYDAHISSFWDVNIGRACFILVKNSPSSNVSIQYTLLLNYLELSNIRDAIRGYIWYLQNAKFNSNGENVYDMNTQMPANITNVENSKQNLLETSELSVAQPSNNTFSSQNKPTTTKPVTIVLIIILAVIGIAGLTMMDSEFNDTNNSSIATPQMNEVNRAQTYTQERDVFFEGIKIGSYYSDYPERFNITHAPDDPDAKENSVLLLNESTSKEGQSDKINGIDVGNIWYYFNKESGLFMGAYARIYFQSNCNKAYCCYYSDFNANYAVKNIRHLDSYLQKLVDYFDMRYGTHIKTTYSGAKGKTDATYRWDLPNHTAVLRLYRRTEEEKFDSVSIRIELICS